MVEVSETPFLNQVSLDTTFYLKSVSNYIKDDGHVIIPRVISEESLASIKKAMYAVQQKIHRDIGKHKLERAGEVGVLRLMMKYDASFLNLLNINAVNDVVSNILGDHAILHLQNGFILPPATEYHKKTFQRRLHMDFPRVLNGCICSLNIMLCVSEFTSASGGTKIIPGSHQGKWNPQMGEANLVDVVCPAGSLVIFDSTLWHCAGVNNSGRDRLAINHQFTPPYFKQQIDYVKAFEEDEIKMMSQKIQKYLGMDTRLPSSLQEYYVPSEERLYKGGQG